MNIEWERKFLVNKQIFYDYLNNNHISNIPVDIEQGYLLIDNQKEIRVRILDHKNAKLTIKFQGTDKLTVSNRTEYEYDIPILDAKSMYSQCHYFINKQRLDIPFQDGNSKFIISVDNFLGKNEGLMIAEIEGIDRGNRIEFPNDYPDFVSTEVTNDHKYYGNYLARNPYSEWNNK